MLSPRRAMDRAIACAQCVASTYWLSLLPGFTLLVPFSCSMGIALPNKVKIHKPCIFMMQSHLLGSALWRPPPVSSNSISHSISNIHPFSSCYLCEQSKVDNSHPHKHAPLPPLPDRSFNFYKDLEAQDIFRKPFNHTFQFRSHWSHVSM